MKKPDITEGEWEEMTFMNDDGTIHSITIDPGKESDKCICALYPQSTRSFYVKEFKANAQAIKSVPKMIDALLFAKTVIAEALAGEGDKGAWEDGLNDVREALTKAGVEL